MYDHRETILLLIQEILGGIEGAPSDEVFRNRMALPPEIRPCSLLLDGEEEVVSTMAERMSGRGVTGPKKLIVDLQPDIIYAIKTRSLKDHAEVGPTMSTARVAIIRAFLFSDELASLLGPNGGVFYRGHLTDLKDGMRGLGTQQLFFKFRYVLDPEHIRT